uniref:Transposable element protein, putative, Transposase_28 n=1 Tax=Oryza sativa subsp. japonica TaxID=39947 RepID=Q2QWA7_ORYSJ|nr:Transposable element protein, putative, Transposase_28 [Oryza sativa Japonica Group]
MAPRKPNPASAKGPDPGRIDDDTTAFLGVSLMDDAELAKLVRSGALVEGKAFAPGNAVVPKTVNNQTVVFAVFFEAGLRFPCNVLLPEILRLFQVELLQLSPSALVRIAIFDWVCRTSGFEPSAGLFGAIFFATVNSKTLITSAETKKTLFGSVNFNVRPERSDLWPVNAAMSRWDRHWMARWFYQTIPFEAGSKSAKALRCRRRAIAPNRKPKIAVDSAMEARFALLRKVAKALIAFSAGKVAKGDPAKKTAKKRGLVDVARVFSDDESSDETPTSPAGRSLDLSTAPVLLIDAGGADGSVAAVASASADRVVQAAARVFGSPLRQLVASPLVKLKGKGAAVETSASDFSLATPHFAPGDFETRAELIPFVEGILAVHSSIERTVRARLDRFKNRLRAKDDDLGRKGLEMEALASTLKEAKAENKRLQVELEKGREAMAKVDRLKVELEKEKAHSAALTDYYNLTKPKIEALRLEVSKAEASAAAESQHFSREMARTTASAKLACQTLRLALSDMGARVRGVLGEDASAFDFSEWTLQAGGAISTAPPHAAIAAHSGCEHIAEFPNYVKGDWEISSQDVLPALRAWWWQFWQKDGRSTAKARLLEQLAKAEDQGEEEDAAAGVGGGDAQDHPEVVGWMRAHLRQTLEDYDRVHKKRLEDMVHFWRNHQKTDRQEVISKRRYSLACVSPPSPLRVVYDVSDDEPSLPNHSLGGEGGCGGESVIYL